MPPVLGCIADDVTGATDLAVNLVEGGAQVVQHLTIPQVDDLLDTEAEAIVVALKIRSIDASEAVSQARAALDSLRQAGCRRFYFKYCSTFDSTEQGNIGPVAGALLESIGEKQTVFCPAFPDTGRTVYSGHLFVNGALLNESGMQDHPLNPMTDSNLLRVLQAQAKQSVGLLGYDAVHAGVQAIQQRLAELESTGCEFVVCDALDNGQLQKLAKGLSGMRLLTGGSGLPRFLPSVYHEAGLMSARREATVRLATDRQAAILAGSCSQATRAQVAWMKSHCPSWQIDPQQVVCAEQQQLASAIEWAGGQPRDMPLLFYSSADPEQVSVAQETFGRAEVAHTVERFHARLAARLTRELGIGRLIVAGGETSGAVVNELGISALKIGRAIAPGVPWTQTFGDPPLDLALKSGNFGKEDFFQRALQVQSDQPPVSTSLDSPEGAD